MKIDKMNKYLITTDIINNTIRARETLNKTRMKLHNTVALPTLLYVSENFNIKRQDTFGQSKTKQNVFSHQLMHFHIQLCINLLSYIKIT
jgi:hypothetical protein